MQKIGFAQLKTTTGQPVEWNEIEKSRLYQTPSNLGGVFTIECIHVCQNKAQFTCTSKDWPYSYELDFSEENLSNEQIIEVAEIVNAWGSPSFGPSDEGSRIKYSSFADVSSEQALLLRKANRFGMIAIYSYTQLQWTDQGIEMSREAKAA